MKTCDTCKHPVQFRGQRMECDLLPGKPARAEAARQERGVCGPDGKFWAPIETKKEEEKNV